MQNALFSKISLEFGNRKFSTQNEVKHSFHHRVVFFQQILMQNVFVSTISLQFGKRKFSTQNEVEDSFQQRSVFFEQI